MLKKVLEFMKVIQSLNVEVEISKFEKIAAKGITELKTMDDDGNGKISVMELIDYIADEIAEKID